MTGTLESFKEKSDESPGFECDRLLLINAPDAVNGMHLDEQDVAPVAHGILREAGGFFNGKITHFNCFFKQSYEERSWNFGGNERRQVMVVPKAHSIYLFDENERHLSTRSLD